MTGDVRLLRGAGWHWRPTYRFTFPEDGQPVRVWSGFEVLTDGEGRYLRRGDDGAIGPDVQGGLIQRQAPSPDWSPDLAGAGGAA